MFGAVLGVDIAQTSFQPFCMVQWVNDNVIKMEAANGAGCVRLVCSTSLHHHPAARLPHNFPLKYVVILWGIQTYIKWRVLRPPVLCIGHHARAHTHTHKHIQYTHTPVCRFSCYPCALLITVPLSLLPV